MKKRIVIIYKSYLGTTKQYADWLTESLNADEFTFNDFSENDFEKYETFIIMSGTYAGQMPLAKYLTKNWSRLFGKQVIAVSVGFIPNEKAESQRVYCTIPKNIRDKVAYTKLPGKILEVNKKNIKIENINEIIKLL
ncbi:MAG: flavodoxin domain-containing protein [Patescibacteria group bacterium]|jgi:flavodoxin|nr:flavodoxin domain-containing protein [Patescibacteria group bacterium]